jgi:hypothetical protein
LTNPLSVKGRAEGYKVMDFNFLNAWFSNPYLQVHLTSQLSLSACRLTVDIHSKHPEI